MTLVVGGAVNGSHPVTPAEDFGHGGTVFDMHLSTGCWTDSPMRSFRLRARTATKAPAGAPLALRHLRRSFRPAATNLGRTTPLVRRCRTQRHRRLMSLEIVPPPGVKVEIGSSPSAAQADNPSAPELTGNHWAPRVVHGLDRKAVAAVRRIQSAGTCSASLFMPSCAGRQ